jgi:hypothetical protein
VRDVSCSGARTDDLFAPQAVFGGRNPPQLDALDAGVSTVTLQIGGNDIGFTEIIKNCAAASPYGPTQVGPNCKSYYDPGGTPANDQLQQRIDAAAGSVDTVLTRIQQNAPNAKIIVVGYPAILPLTGTGCWPQMPLTLTDVPYLRATEEHLNSMLANEASLHGATYVDTYGPSADKNACQPPILRWVEPVVPVNAAAPVHPNLIGEAGMGALVRPALG